MIFSQLFLVLRNVILTVALGTLLLGCANNNGNKLVFPGGVGTALPRAEYQIRGKTRNDQLWVDKTIEAEVAGFGFARPKPRPASWDAPKKKPKPVAKKRTIIQRVLHRKEVPVEPVEENEPPSPLPDPLPETRWPAAPPSADPPKEFPPAILEQPAKPKPEKKKGFIKKWWDKEKPN